jgi:stress-induced morphogen
MPTLSPPRPFHATSLRDATVRTRNDRDDALSTDRLKILLDRAFPEASEVSILDRTGGGDHFQVTVATPRFDGLSLVEQHRLVYDALAQPLADGTIHELRIKTKGL